RSAENHATQRPDKTHLQPPKLILKLHKRHTGTLHSQRRASHNSDGATVTRPANPHAPRGRVFSESGSALPATVSLSSISQFTNLPAYTPPSSPTRDNN